MKILYRCPQCSSVIERTNEWDEILKMAPERAVFECGICHRIIPGSDVLSGKYDLAPEPVRGRPDKLRDFWRLIRFHAFTRGRTPETPLIEDLLAQLKQEHETKYVYRGQTRIWPGPLIPSAYRGIVSPKPYLGWNPSMRLRNVGCVFHEEIPMATEDSKKAKDLEVLHYLRLVFGYPFAQILGQHYGYPIQISRPFSPLLIFRPGGS